LQDLTPKSQNLVTPKSDPKIDATVRGRMEQNFRELGEPVPDRR